MLLTMLLDAGEHTTAETMAKKLGEAIKATNIRPVDISIACGVSKQAVNGWLKTGRIDKRHLPALAALTQLPLEWWLNTSPPPPTAAPQYGIQALARLQVIGQNLSESDWQALIHVAQQLASKASPAQPANPQQLPPQILPEYTDAIEEQVREAHERYEKEHKRRRAAPG